MYCTPGHKNKGQNVLSACLTELHSSPHYTSKAAASHTVEAQTRLTSPTHQPSVWPQRILTIIIYLCTKPLLHCLCQGQTDQIASSPLGSTELLVNNGNTMTKNNRLFICRLRLVYKGRVSSRIFISTYPVNTTTKSITFHPLRRYEPLWKAKPRAMILIPASKQNIPMK